MSRKPVVGIAANYQPRIPNGGHQVGYDYVASPILGGMVPFILPSVLQVEVIEEMVSHLDGVILCGGEDVDPKLFGEEPATFLGEVDRARDDVEMALLEAAVKQGKPVFGICRGLQVINIAYGGTLIQDIGSQCPGALEHFGDMTVRPHVNHDILISENTWLRRTVGKAQTGVNSYHHQAIKDVAEGFTVSAVSKEDGIIEAIEWEEKDIYAVQFHPENMAAWVGDMRALFDGFAEVMRAKM